MNRRPPLRVDHRRPGRHFIAWNHRAAEPAVDQGEVCGYPISWNPDDDRFYVHERGVVDGSGVLGTYSDLRNAVQHARRLGAS